MWSGSLMLCLRDRVSCSLHLPQPWCESLLLKQEVSPRASWPLAFLYCPCSAAQAVRMLRLWGTVHNRSLPSLKSGDAAPDLNV